jgi:glycosyltransferase involved in cell wall biosynthesis/arylsulfatase A-like enzyme
MRIDFYHIDGMEIPNYVPVWRALVEMGVDARLVTVPDPHNTAAKGWFDFDATTRRYQQMGIDYTTVPDYECDLAVTTQYPVILAPYKGLKVRMMYAPNMLSDSFGHSKDATEAFDGVLVHGPYSQRRLSRWKRKDDLLIAGHPRCDDFFLGKYAPHKAQYRLQHPNRRPVISYLPTWAEASTLDTFLDAVARLSGRYDVLLKPHHCTLRLELERMQRVNACGATVVVDASELAIMYALSDVVLADVRSGAFYEAMALGVPVVALTAAPEDTAKHLDPRALAGAPLCAAPEDLPRLIDEMLAHDQYAEGRDRLGRDLVAFRDGTAAAHAATELVAFVERCGRRVAAPKPTLAAASRTVGTGGEGENRKRNIVWVCLDGLRPDQLRCCGNQERSELYVDRLLAKGGLFTRMFTAGGNTKTSSHAALTSMYGASHGVNGHDDACLRNLDPFVLTLADFLKRHGYATFRYSDMPSRFQPTSGFDLFGDSGYATLRDTPGHSYDVPRRRSFIEQFNAEQRPKFAYLHLDLLHELGGEQGGLVWTTKMYGRIIRELSADTELVMKTLDIGPDDLLVVSTDHGIDLDVNRLERHQREGVRLDDGHMQVFCSFAAREWTPRSIGQVVRTIDIAPTILDAVGCGAMGAQGISLLPLLRGESQAPLEAFMARGSTYETIPHGTSPCTWGVRTDTWKYVTHKWRQEAEWLMDLEHDADYTNNLIGKGLPIESELRERVRQTLIEGAKTPRQIYAENGQTFSRRDIPPVVSAIMPVEHASPELDEAIAGLLGQTGPYLELIIADGEPSEQTAAAIAARYGNHPLVHYHRLKGAALGDLLNHGISAARGSVIGLVWPNGRYRENYFYEMTKVLDRDAGVGLVYADWIGSPVSGRPPVKNLVPAFSKSALQARNYLGMCVLFTADLARKAGPFDNTNRPLAWDMWKRMAEIAPFRAANVSLATFTACPHRYVAGEAAKGASPATAKPSIVLPTYNHLKFLPLAIESVLTQTHTDFELVIVNDGSTDGTREWLDRLTDPRIKVIHQDNTRLPAALNAGFRAATGSLLTWISADNWCAPTFLETLMGALAAYPDAGFVSSAYACIDERGNIIKIHRNPDYSLHTLMSGNPGTASFMYRRACHDDVGYNDTDLEGAEDWDMWLRIHERFRTVYVPDVLYYYRYHANSMTAQKQERVTEAGRQTITKLYQRNKGAFDISRIYPAIAQCANKPKAVTEACFDFGSALLRSPFNPVDAAIKCFEEARRAAPRDRAIASNLAIAYGVAKRFDDAERVVNELNTRLASGAPDETLQRLLAASQQKDSKAFATIPLYSVDKARSELFRIEATSRLLYTHHAGDAPRA